MHARTRTAIATLVLVLSTCKLPASLARGGSDPAPGGGPAVLRPELRHDVPPPLEPPAVGTWSLRLLDPRFLELALVTTVAKDARPATWDWVDEDRTRLPDAAAFEVDVDGRRVAVDKVGFRRRVIFAPMSHRDLRVGNSLVLRLAAPVPDGATVTLRDPKGAAWSSGPLTVRADPLRDSPVLHVDRTGYGPDLPKRAFAGRYLGSLGELPLADGMSFRVVDDATGAEALAGTLVRHPDQGFELDVPPYRQVLEADFTAIDRPGRYRLVVPGLGRSPPFTVDPGAPAAWARAFALGVYHQRCGSADALPFTRFVHAPCHVAPAEVPTPAFRKVEDELAGNAEKQKKDGMGDQQAPILDRVEASLFPFVRQGKIDVSGGHHDAGDYSKYTTNSAALVHALVLAVDAFPGVADLDGMGLPESGDGRPDLLQEAKLESDFLLKMQDDDGGFYFLVYPKERRYEDDVPPDRGDRQIVFPKNTAATGAATAALAQAGSSPAFRRLWPDVADRYLEAARKGWAFLQRAFQEHGRHGAYQRISHYGDKFDDDDEVAWAATELYLATGDESAHKRLLAEFDPSDVHTRQWQWVRLTEGYGAAIRSYALAEKTGRVPAGGLDPRHLKRCQAELRAAGEELAAWSRKDAYRASFPIENKRFRSSGWYFSPEALFNLAAAWSLDPRPEFVQAAAANLTWEGGANPLDVTFTTGMGVRWPVDPVSQTAVNDDRALPPDGLPVGDVEAGFDWNGTNGKDPRRLTFPDDGGTDDPYPLYDRWADAWNTSAEAVTATMGRALAGAAWLAALHPFPAPAWRAATARIAGLSDRVPAGSRLTAWLVIDGGPDPKDAFVVWEAKGEAPTAGADRTVAPSRPGRFWVEAEARWPDGRRAFARREVEVVEEAR